ncbi:MAG TPA: Maf family protein [Devosiaceae bacterium]|jgi:septum formation protein|nr:Maf family protein [Devosiaceae bacterium]
MLILASRSNARKALLLAAGLEFGTEPSQIDERAVENETAARGADGRGIALALAEAKASEVAARRPADVVVAADQTLALGYELLHKPGTLPDAARQLDHLRGRTHRLHAGVALAVEGVLVWSAVDTAELTMREFDAAERDAVLALEGGRVLESVGGYRLEGPSVRLFESIRGDYFTILGLPLLQLLGALRLHAPDLLATARP